MKVFLGQRQGKNKDLYISIHEVHNQLDFIQEQTRPSSDSEAATMYKLKGQSSNMQTGQSFETRELVRLDDLSS